MDFDATGLLWGLAAACLLARLSMIWTTGHEEWGPRLLWLAGLCFVLGVASYFWPKSHETAVHVESRNQSGGQTAQTIINLNTLSSPHSKSPSEFKEALPGQLFDFSVNCMSFQPFGELFEGIQSGKPTPFISVQNPTGENTPLVSFYMKQGTLYTDIAMFTPHNGTAFDLTAGSFSHARAFDANFSDRALEVVDGSGTPIFQLVRQSQTRLELYGLFRAPGRVFLLGVNGPYAKVLRDEEADQHVAPANFLPKMFQYPSWKHPSVYADPENIRSPCPSATRERIFGATKGLVIQ